MPNQHHLQGEYHDKKIFNAIRDFFHMEASGGLMLVLSAVLALVVANSSWYDIYHHFLTQINFTIGFTQDGVGVFSLSKPVLLWVNDALMAIFFFLVGLEIKREIVKGELSSRDRMLLPVLGAVGGMVVPALIYIGINYSSPDNWAGWAIPSATDIAFSIAVLAVLGSRIPFSIKILLTAIAIVDDLGAIVIIALFYSTPAEYNPLIIGAAILVFMAFLNWKGVSRTAPYILLGMVLWFMLLKSGVHPTLGGVLTAFAIPLSSLKKPNYNPAQALEKALHPWVAFGILPLFAFANAGVPFHNIGLHSFSDPVALGIAAGLFAGKTIGITLFIALAVWLKLCSFPSKANWLHVIGVAMTAGIGFTMSLFIGELAFHDMAHQASIRLGVLVGSVLAALGGYALLRYASTLPTRE